LPSKEISKIFAAAAIGRKFSVTRFWDEIRKYNATAFSYIGEICHYLMNQPFNPDDSKNSVKTVIGNGLRPEIWIDFKKRLTSGGKRANYSWETSIVEINAATGEIYIPERNYTILGSAGTALQLKFYNEEVKNPNLNLILVENDDDCVYHLKNVIERKFPRATINDDPSCLDRNVNQCVLIRRDVNEAVRAVNDLNIGGRTIYFFDPLLAIEIVPIKEVYNNRVKSPFNIGTEFSIFFFTSDWFLGRDDLAPLPLSSDFSSWSDTQRVTINALSNVLGDDLWYDNILIGDKIERRIDNLTEEYQNRLYELFRFVIPMPFAPKKDQVYHLFFCSNYHEGAKIITNFYSNETDNKWKPNNMLHYKKFKELYENTIFFPGGSSRPNEWKVLWRIVTYYRLGKFDKLCGDLIEIAQSESRLLKTIDWLKSEGYVKNYSTTRFELNWEPITNNLGLEQPPPFEPLRDTDFID